MTAPISAALAHVMEALERLRETTANMTRPLSREEMMMTFAAGRAAIVYGWPAVLRDRRLARRIARRTGMNFSVRMNRGRRVFVWPSGMTPRSLDVPRGLRSAI